MEKNLKISIIAIVAMFIIGFGGLIIYSLIYSNQVEERQSTQINNLESSVEETPKTEDEELKEQYDDKESIKQNIVIPSTGESEVITENVSDSLIEQSRLDIKKYVLVGDFASAGKVANKVLSEYFIEDGDLYSEFYKYQDFAYWNDISSLEKMGIANSTSDPAVYLAILYSLAPEYQVETMPSADTIYIPTNAENPLVIGNIEFGPSGNTRVNEFFSSAKKEEIYKVVVDASGTSYNVYLVAKSGYPTKITNIEVADKDSTVFVTYNEYFKLYGKKDTSIYDSIS